VLLLFLREAPAVVAPAATTTTTTTTTTPAPHPLSPALRRRLVVIGLFSLGAVADTFLLVRANELGLSTPMLPVVWVVLHLAKVLAHRVEKLLLGKGLGEVILRADHAPACLVEQAVLGRQHDHRHVGETGVALDDGAGLVAIQTGHEDVAENQRGRFFNNAGKGLKTILGQTNGVARLRKEDFR
jgi:hypothetical protein